MNVSQNNHDRNLIFGIVALHLDFISQDQLITGMQQWLLDKSRTLGDVLMAQGVLNESRKKMLSLLVEEHLQQHGNDPAKSLNTFQNCSRIREELQSLGDPDIYRAASMMPGANQGDAVGLMTMPHATDRKSPMESRFTLVRRLAEGGLGVVWVAVDSELVREVALKEIKPQFADHGNSRARFLQEAEITGRLEHPGIVPVYGLGKYLDGRPYYAMRMIKGESLQSAIDQFHESRAYAAQQTLALRDLLRRFIDICDAVEYAHSRGILHRDLKPDNVMLGKYGETLVVDWGLAKAIGEADLRTRSDETVIMPELGEDSVPTKMGEVVGTVAFMSPEQALGKHRDLRPASDIFSLGAILYNLLSGQPAQKGGSVAVLLNNVREGKFRRPREIKPTVPRALEAICLKAMSRWPEDRYGSAKELAMDIERYLADEPIAVYCEPLIPRLRRWARRHPKTITTLLVTTLLAVTFSWLLFLGEKQHRVELGKSYAELEETHDRLAEAHERLEENQGRLQQSNQELEVANRSTEDVLDYMVGVFKSPDQTGVGKNLKVVEVLQPALEDLMTEDAENRYGPIGRAKLLHAIGQAFLGIGVYDQSVVANKEALRLRRQELGEEHPDTLSTTNNLATGYEELGELTELLELYESNYELTRKTKGEHHEDTINSLNNLSRFLFTARRYEEAVSRYQVALQLAQQEFGEDHPNTLIIKFGLSACYRELREFDKALPLAHEAYYGLRGLLDYYPKETLTAMNLLGLLSADVGDLENATKLLSQSYHIAKERLHDEDRLPLTIMKNLAQVKHAAGHFDEAMELFERNVKARELNRNVGLSHPNSRETMRRFADCCLDAQRPTKAEEVIRSWISAVDGLAHADLRDRALAQIYLAMALLDQGKLDAARRSADTAAKYLDVHLPETPEQLRALGILALIRYRQQQEAEAAKLLESAFEQADRLAARMTQENFEAITSVGRRVQANLAGEGINAEAVKWRDLLERIRGPQMTIDLEPESQSTEPLRY